MQVQDKIAIVIVGGQSMGLSEAVGDSRAVATLFAREGAKVLVVDRNLTSAEETVGLIREAGSEAADVVSDDANFITGVALPVDGGQSVRVG